LVPVGEHAAAYGLPYQFHTPGRWTRLVALHGLVIGRQEHPKHAVPVEPSDALLFLLKPVDPARDLPVMT
jgi:hypothetical protein